MQTNASASGLPLSGVKVLDLSRALAGTFCSVILGDYGADVIKVEPSPAGDLVREWGPFDGDVSVYFLSANRNKRGIGLNFRSPEGLQLLRKLALQADIIVENFRPGVMREIGLDYAELRQIKPQLIVASISGFGADGPLSSRTGFDQIAQGYSGLMSLTGTEDSGPLRVGVPIGDLTSGMWLAMGILGAWIERQATGQGQRVETSLLSSLMSLLSVQGQRYLTLGQVPQPTGNMHSVIAPYGAFRAQDGDINIAVGTEDMWLKFCDLIERPDLKADPRFVDNGERMGRREELRVIIEKELSRKTRAEWSTLFVRAHIPSGPINSLKEAFADEQVAHLKLVEDFEYPGLGKIRQVANPVVFNGQTGRWIRRPPPVLGEHTREVLIEAGFSSQDVEKWIRTGVVLQDAPAAPELLKAKQTA
ncbi:MAG: CaiB/BaiF CoA transferase family protein [Rhodospirillaceae bacterium]